MRRIVSIVAAAALLFCQLALAAYACPMAAPAAVEVSAPAHGDCCDGPAPSPLCGVHCGQDAQAQKPYQPEQVSPPASTVIASRPDFFVVIRLPAAAPPLVRAGRPPSPEPGIRNTRLRI